MEGRTTRICDDCKYFESGKVATDESGVCLLLTEWEEKALWWKYYYDEACEDFELYED